MILKLTKKYNTYESKQEDYIMLVDEQTGETICIRISEQKIREIKNIIKNESQIKLKL